MMSIVMAVTKVQLSITASGGTGNYSYVWSNFYDRTKYQFTYNRYLYRTVKDANLCEKTGSWFISEPTLLTVIGNATGNVCYLYSNGTVDITASGGTLNYSYKWSTGATTEDITALTAGTYFCDCYRCETHVKLQEAGMSANLICGRFGISGELNVCCSTSTTNGNDYVYTVAGLYPSGLSGLTYQWVVEGGSIVTGPIPGGGGYSAPNSPTIMVTWTCCGSGKVYLTITRPGPCSLTKHIDIIIPQHLRQLSAGRYL